MMALGIIGSVMSAIGAISAASSQAAAANYNAKVADINAETATLQAATDAKMAREKEAKQLGSFRAAAAANGLDMTGSVMDLGADVMMEHEMNIRSIVYQGQVKTTDYKNQATAYRLEAKNAMTAGVIGAMTGAVQGFGQVLKLA